VTAANGNEGVQISAIELNEAIHCRPGVAVATVTIDQKSLTLPADSRATLNATITPRETFEREVAWVSSDPTVAEVRRIGEQVAIVVGKQPGRCTVTATSDNVKQTCSVTVTPSTLPTGWSYTELNTPAIPGAVLVSDGKFTLTGCGHAMTSWWERVRDQGVFVSKPVKGDAEISARLTSAAPNVGGPAYQWDHRPPTASGLMIRESLTEKCGRFLLVQIETSGVLVCRWRDKTGDQDDNQMKSLGQATLPIHLKLVQKGNQIRVFVSPDGRNWGEPRMAQAAAFDEQSRIGLFVCSGNTFASTTAVFDSVHVSP
jgi:regulation of enolase protein 1 (concanavalin A-like superfamily)